MKEKLLKYISEIQNFSPATLEDLNSFRIKFLSKKGILSVLFEEFKKVPINQKREIGKILNDLKNLLENKVTTFQSKFESIFIS